MEESPVRDNLHRSRSFFHAVVGSEDVPANFVHELFEGLLHRECGFRKPGVRRVPMAWAEPAIAET